jgi:ParB family chromosome partitioning protein
MSKQTKDRPKLGRGLSSLLSMAAPEAPHESEEPRSTPLLKEVGGPSSADQPNPPATIPIARISINPHQPRKHFSEASLAELAASIHTTGLIQPIIVRQMGDAYQLIAGERRWRAAKLAGLTDIAAIVRDVDGYSQAQMALVENIQREDLNPIDRAQAYQTLMDQLGATQAELAARLGEDRSTIANHLRLLDLAEPVRAHILAGALTLGHAKILASISDLAEQERIANLCVQQTLSVRNLERMLAAAPPAPAKASRTLSAHFTEVEQSCARQLGMKVQLKSTGSKGSGRFVIHYGSLDQFDELLQRLGVKLDS